MEVGMKIINIILQNRDKELRILDDVRADREYGAVLTAWQLYHEERRSGKPFHRLELNASADITLRLDSILGIELHTLDAEYDEYYIGVSVESKKGDMKRNLAIAERTDTNMGFN
jgi:hypothetical protein